MREGDYPIMMGEGRIGRRSITLFDTAPSGLARGVRCSTWNTQHVECCRLSSTVADVPRGTSADAFRPVVHACRTALPQVSVVTADVPRGTFTRQESPDSPPEESTNTSRPALIDQSSSVHDRGGPACRIVDRRLTHDQPPTAA